MRGTQSADPATGDPPLDAPSSQDAHAVASLMLGEVPSQLPMEQPVITAVRQPEQTYAPWYSPSNADGNLKFVAVVSRCPCITLAMVYLLCILCTAALVGQIRGQPIDEIFSSPRTEYDLADIRSMKQDSLSVAIDSVDSLRATKTDSEATEVENVAKPMSQQLDAMMFFYESPTTIFDADAAAALKDIESTVVEHKKFSDFCKRRYLNDTDDSAYECSTSKTPYDFSPIKFLFASHFDAELAMSVIERLKDDKQKSDYIMMSRCYESPVPQPLVIDGKIVPEHQVQLMFENSCDPGCVQQACKLTQEDKAAARNLSTDITSIIGKWDGGAEAPVSDMKTLAEFVAWMKLLPTRARIVDFHLDRSFNESNLSCKWSRSSISFGGPFPDLKDDGSRVFDNIASSRDTQIDRMKSWVMGEVIAKIDEASKPSYSPDIHMTWFMASISFDAILDLLLIDALLAIISIVVVFSYLWLTTGSCFLAIIGMSEIIFSIPIAWLIMRSFGVNYFGVINAMCIFIVCAIGADDIFVFQDAYVQSQFQGPEVNRDFETRMSWVYRKSGTAMFITSTTTCAAFLCCVLTPIPGTQSFGIYAALVVAVDYLLVMTMFCSAVMVYSNHFEKPPLCSCTVPTPIGLQACGCCCENCDVSATKPSPTELAFLASNQATVDRKPDRVEHFFRSKFAPMLLKKRSRMIIVFASIVWLIPATIYLFRLQPTTQTEQFLSSDHPLQRAIEIMNTKFGATAQDQGIDVFYTWGLDEVQRNGANMLLNLTYLGEPGYADGWHFTPSCMNKMREVCDDFRFNTSDYYLELFQRNEKAEGSIKCFVYDLDERVRTEGWKLDSADAINSIMGDFMKSNALPEDATTPSQTRVEKKYKSMLGYDGDVVKFVGIALEAAALTPDNRPSENQARVEYDKFEALRSHIDSIAADECGHVQMTDLDGKFVFMNNQRIYRTSAVTGSIIGAGIAFVVILACTWSFIISSFATLSILFTMISVIGLTTMMGWELGTIQSILISILAGFSVDYVVHLAHAYSHSAGSRKQRLVDAFSEMGSPVLSGMITSVGASLPLFGCKLVFFAQFGTFLCFTIAFSWLFANLFFMSAMVTFGPQDDLGEVGKEKEATTKTISQSDVSLSDIPPCT